jgi:hypothetical protein
MAAAVTTPGEQSIVVVSDIKNIGTGLWRVRVMGPDQIIRHLIIPDSIATLVGVKVSAIAYAQLLARGLVRP